MLLVLFAPNIHWSHFFAARSKSRVENFASTVVKVLVSGADQYEVLDGNGARVTDRLSAGLSAGRYTLHASKPGFHDYHRGFDIDPREGAEKDLAVQWEALPTVVKMLTRVVGSLRVDGVDQKIESGGELTLPWSNGHHTMDWKDASDELQLQFDVKDDSVIMSDTTLHGANIVGIIFVASRGEVKYQAINSASGVLKSVNEKPDEIMPPAGTFTFESASPVRFKRKADPIALGGFLPETSGAPVVSLFIKQFPNVSSRSQPAPVEQPPPTPPPPPVVEPPPIPKPTQEEIEKKQLQEKAAEFEKKYLPEKKKQ
jgi:hypothetical protein